MRVLISVTCLPRLLLYEHAYTLLGEKAEAFTAMDSKMSQLCTILVARRGSLALFQ